MSKNIVENMVEKEIENMVENMIEHMVQNCPKTSDTTCASSIQRVEGSMHACASRPQRREVSTYTGASRPQTVGAKDMDTKSENQHQKGQQAFQTTVDSENRRRDRQRILHETGLREEGSRTVHIVARTNNKPLATGYQRIVYGDHGPYLEFLPQQVHWKEFEGVDYKPGNPYYLDS